MSILKDIIEKLPHLPRVLFGEVEACCSSVELWGGWL